MTKRNTLADNLLVNPDGNGTWAEYIKTSKFSKDGLLEHVIRQLMRDETLPEDQRGELRELYCDLYPEDALAYGLIHDPNKEPDWWENLPTSSEPKSPEWWEQIPAP